MRYVNFDLVCNYLNFSSHNYDLACSYENKI